MNPVSSNLAAIHTGIPELESHSTVLEVHRLAEEVDANSGLKGREEC